jgi:hypothetical protein
MDDPALALIVEECLALLDAGEDFDAVIGRFPDFTENLAPLLRVAMDLKETADEAIDIPLVFLRELGEFLKDQVEELAD